MARKAVPGGILVGDLVPPCQELEHKVGTGHIGHIHGGIVQDHGIGLVFSQDACCQGQVSAGREAAGGDLLRVDVPLVSIFPDVADEPGNLLQRAEIACVPTGGIAQDEGMVAPGAVAQSHGLRLPGRAVDIAAAGTDHDGRPVLLLTQGDLAVEKIGFHGGFRMAGTGKIQNFHKNGSFREVWSVVSGVFSEWGCTESGTIPCLPL